MPAKTTSSRKRQELNLYLEQFREREEKNEKSVPFPPKREKRAKATRVDDIAIIGMAGRFPDSPNLESFWQNLIEEENLIHEVPTDRWNSEEDEHKTAYLGNIGDVFRFDNGLFGLSPREAEAMDPHQRVLLEVVWETLEHAGYAPSQLSGTKTGVFIAMYNSDFVTRSRWAQWDPESLSYLATGSGTLISNRISYHFNWQGPSENVATACSSALVALHKASLAMRTGDCDMALVGGVSLLLAPERMRILDQLGILSSAGYCAPFDSCSPGEIMGEGAGAVLLKPLARAREDGDAIHALLKATGTNHHGSASGSITMPSVQAQRDLIVETYRRANVDPHTISYVEAHGSGNVDGDKVEILALKQAFSALMGERTTADSQGCAIGSGKGNTGFLEAAGGMAQLLKVILSMQQRTLPATLNFREVDEFLNLQDSCFFIVDKTTPWKEMRDTSGKVLPRRGALNAYGLGGTNAHVVIEEYVPPSVCENDRARAEGDPQLIVLSAKTEEQLQTMAENLVQHVANWPQINPEYLRSVAYTLQVGRESLEQRLAVAVPDLLTLLEKLTAYLNGKKDVEHLFCGHVDQEDSILEVFACDVDVQEAIEKWIGKGKLPALARLWAAGAEINWHLFYPERKPLRVPLPSYPFAITRYPIPKANPRASGGNRDHQNEVLHPLIHKNISDLEALRYTTLFTGREFFLTDHLVKAQKVLPGVVYLAMAKAAGDLAVPSSHITQLKDVVWMTPLVVQDAPLESQIQLFTAGDEDLAFEVASGTQPDPTLHCQGKLVAIERTDCAALDIPAILARCPSTIEGEDCYAYLRKQGMVHGPSLQGLMQILHNEREALAKIQLPPQVSEVEYDLHPALLDAALVATVGFFADRNSQAQSALHLPFAVRSVEIYATLPANAYAHVTRGRSSGNLSAGGRRGQSPEAEDGVLQFDITLTDTQGNVCVVLQSFTVRALATSHKPDLHFYAPEWQVQSLNTLDTEAAEKEADTTLLLVGADQEGVDKLSAALDPVKVVAIASPPKSDPVPLIEESWRHLRVLAQEEPVVQQQILIVAAGEVGLRLSASLSALLKTTSMEQPSIRGKIVTFADLRRKNLVALLEQEIDMADDHGIEIHYDATGRRTIKTLREMATSFEGSEAYLKSGGVYWITGGLGGLGRICARHLIDRGENITVVLSGRRRLDADGFDDAGEQHMVEFDQLPAQVIYLQVDVTQLADVKRAVQKIKDEHGALNGIIHGAGILRGDLVTETMPNELEAALAPKVTGILNLDAATQSEALDFMVLFSSVAGVLGQRGHADYAAANAFLDSFAHARQALMERGERSGHTLSINWPLWAEGGMISLDAQSLRLMERWTGMAALSTEAGTQAFDKLMRSTRIAASPSQILVAFGATERVRGKLLMDTRKPVTSRSSPENVDQDTSALAKRIQGELTTTVARLLKVNADEVDGAKAFSAYGANSITLIGLTNWLNETLKLDLMPTLFFEQNTLTSLSLYLAEHHSDSLSRLLEGQPGEETMPLSEGPSASRSHGFIQRRRLATRQEKWGAVQSPLVPLQSRGLRPPFFCVHPWAGVVYPYADLAAGLGVEQPFYGIQAVGLYQEPHTSVEEMASHYLEALRGVHPAPPYLLGGWSLGALIAFEMAQQLTRVGEKVALLAIIDMPAPILAKQRICLNMVKFLVNGFAPHMWPYVVDYARVVAKFEDPQPSKWQVIRATIKELQALTDRHSVARRIIATLKAGSFATANYLPRPYRGKVTLFRTERQLVTGKAMDSLGWESLALEGVEVYRLPGHHFNIMQRPHVGVLAKHLRSCLEQVQPGWG